MRFALLIALLLIAAPGFAQDQTHRKNDDGTVNDGTVTYTGGCLVGPLTVRVAGTILILKRGQSYPAGCKGEQ